MPFRNMTLDELAAHIGIDAREVRRWADAGRLPGQMIGGAWRFNQAALLDWLQQEIHNLDERHVRDLERAMADGRGDDVVSALIPVDGIELSLPARSKSSVLRELVRVAEQTGLLYDRDGLVAALEEREQLGSTALPGGLAIPHPRRPMPYATAEPLVCVARVPAGIPFGAPDGRLTDLFVLVCTHDERHHLQVLARIALMFSGDLADRVREATDRHDALAVITASERVAMPPAPR
jgi:PTS system nitrogen regulatory IIA component